MKLLHRIIALFLAFLLVGCHTVPTSLNVASFNLRYANHHDSLANNGWGQRLPMIAQMIQFHDFDIFGSQEGLYPQLEELKAQLPQYNYIGIGREDGIHQGEHSAIFYREDLFDVVEHGDFWLSETPDRPSKGWDAVLERICTWGHFKVKETGFEFLFFNLHMDHRGKKARVESAFLVQKKMDELGKNLPAILTGDFNVDQTHDSYKALTESGLLRDCYEVASLRYAPNGTFNVFDPNAFTQSRIDHIFVSKAFKVEKYGVLTDTYRLPLKEEKMKDRGDYPVEIRVNRYEAHTDRKSVV